ncbi:glycosyltransferase family 4 protein [Actinophytocola algeriensis]|uniref:Glycosyltransferase involved in cell wall biosynthesis n=1 Tax=Actinophytocola algeriensis TaxID=1768010 RepID=A0A7W7QBK4_9PSEU|nr:glycosyltransferase family 4 protein [Actinophytocola algeriensis]MBB4910640.1 glycosyltransferase involved in cell wall biosynthesis [Actinophytocola algeriensis]MBE1473633.1 glycosyltransferase involved in cell wall biosynthesis [Actinophytocola algeriensis]
MTERVLLVARSAGGPDGVSVEVAKWAAVLRDHAMDVVVVAATGTPDVRIDLLGPRPADPGTPRRWEVLLDGADLVIVHNILTLPLDLPALPYLVGTLAGRAVIVHHHDIPWDRPRPVPPGFPPDDDRWCHVVNSHRAMAAFAEHGIRAAVVPNLFEPDPVAGDRHGARRQLGLDDADLLVLHPTRAIPRKEVPTAVRIAEELGGVYWLAGPAEDGYDGRLRRVLASASTRVRHGLGRLTMAEAYAAADVIVYPSSIEGFGNPLVEAALWRKPLIGGDYPVAAEFAARGLRWFRTSEVGELRAWLARPDHRLLDHNREIAVRNFSVGAVAPLLMDVVREVAEKTRTPNRFVV